MPSKKMKRLKLWDVNLQVFTKTNIFDYHVNWMCKWEITFALRISLNIMLTGRVSGTAAKSEYQQNPSSENFSPQPLLLLLLLLLILLFLLLLFLLLLLLFHLLLLLLQFYTNHPLLHWEKIMSHDHCHHKTIFIFVGGDQI